jgi:hypothetical protein
MSLFFFAQLSGAIIFFVGLEFARFKAPWLSYYYLVDPILYFALLLWKSVPHNATPTRKRSIEEVVPNPGLSKPSQLYTFFQAFVP